MKNDQNYFLKNFIFNMSFQPSIIFMLINKCFLIANLSFNILLIYFNLIILEEIYKFNLILHCLFRHYLEIMLEKAL
jgi:hypothetical protein